MAQTRQYGPTPAPAVPGGVVPLNTSAAGALPPLPALQVIVPAATDVVILNPSLQSATQALVLNIPPGGPCEQRRFFVEASGYLQTAQSSTATVKLWKGSSTVTANDVVLGSSGAVAAFNGKRPFSLSAWLIYDSVSGFLDGTFKSIINGVLLAESIITGAPINATLNNLNNPVISFVLSVAFGTATAPNMINVQEFAVNF